MRKDQGKRVEKAIKMNEERTKRGRKEGDIRRGGERAK